MILMPKQKIASVDYVNHIVSECSKLAQKKHKTRHDWVGRVIHWELCKNLKFDHTTKWYMHKPEFILENEMHKIAWDFEIQTDHLIPARSDLGIINKKNENLPYFWFCCPSGHGVKIKESKKINKYLDLARELKKPWNMKVTLIPVVVGVLRMIPKGLEKGLEELEICRRIKTTQTKALLRSTKILRTIPETWGDFLSFRLQ